MRRLAHLLLAEGLWRGYRRKGSFIEYLKRLIDKMHAFHSQSYLLTSDFMTENIESIHFHDSIVVIEKSHRSKPKQITSEPKEWRT